MKRCSLPFFFLGIGVVTIAISYSTQPGGWVHAPFFGGYLLITPEGGAQALNIFLKSMAAVSCLYFLLVTTPVNDLLGLLCRLHAPQILTEMMMMIYRFIFVLLDMTEQITVAQNSRLGNVSYGRKLRSLGILGSSVFIKAFKKSGDLLYAMESRGYDGSFRYLETLTKASPPQKAVLVIYEVILLTAVICLKLGMR